MNMVFQLAEADAALSGWDLKFNRITGVFHSHPSDGARSKSRMKCRGTAHVYRPRMAGTVAVFSDGSRYETSGKSWVRIGN